MPEDPAERQAYLDLGWVELNGVFEGKPYLRWGRDGAGAPAYPQDKPKEPIPLLPLLELLHITPATLETIAMDVLPPPKGCSEHEFEAHVSVKMRFVHRQERDGRKMRSSWRLEDAQAYLAQE